MNVETVCQRLQAHIDSDPYKTSEHFRPAEEALAAQVPGVPTGLIRAYYEKVQSVWPEVGPALQERDDNTLGAWAEAAQSRPGLLWNAVLLSYWKDEPQRLRQGHATLLQLYQAAADPSLPGLPSQDAHFVEALRQAIPCNPRFHYPVGWAAVLVAEGSQRSVEAVRRQLIEPIEDDILDWDLDDLLRLVPSPTTTFARQLLEEVQSRVAARNRRNGQDDFFAALGLSLPATVSLVATLTAKTGHRFILTLSRDWRRTLLSWSAFLGKQQASYLVNENGVLTNKLKFEPYALMELPRLLEDAAKQWKTRWLPPWQFEGAESLDAGLEERFDAFFFAGT